MPSANRVSSYLVDLVVQLSDERLCVRPVGKEKLDGDPEMSLTSDAEIDVGEAAGAEQPGFAEAA